MATTASGVFMSAVHIVAARMEPAEYEVFATLLKVFLLMSLPTVGLQVVFAQQAAGAHDALEQGRLATATRMVLRGTFLFWVLMTLGVAVFRAPIQGTLKITNAAALWFTAGLGLSSLWLPILRGLMQGVQSFGGLGWVAILDGLGRFLAVALIVRSGGQAAGGMAGALAGQAVALGIAWWLTRDLWRGSPGAFAWRPWLGRVVPLTVTFSAILLMTCVDAVFVQSVFPSGQTRFYLAAQMIGVALVTFTTPLAAVMFPKLVAARAEKSDALRLALGATFCICALAALACTLMPRLPLRIIYFRNPDFWQAAPLVPWFAWCLSPLILTNVLAGNLMARGRFGIAPWLGLVAMAYGATLLGLRPRLAGMELFAAFKMVIGTLGGFSLVMLAVTLWFTARDRAEDGEQSRSGEAERRGS